MIERGTFPSIPVVVDAVLVNERFPVVRCNYLSVECDSPGSGWAIRIGDEGLPFMMVGMAGIITQPFGAGRFTDIELIEDLFRRIDDESNLIIEIDDIWLPLSLFDNTGIEPAIGQVYRLKSDLFALAHSFREGGRSLDSFMEDSRKLEQPIELSKEEMDAFSGWRKMQLNKAIEQYPKEPGLKLAYVEESQDR